jgi:hypothetical protein
VEHPIVKELRDQAARNTKTANDPFGARKETVEWRASDEIEKLHKLLARYRDETPLGHQPHMIAHEADELLGRNLSR